MCGRTACTLHPEKLSVLCSYKNSNGSVVTPQWDKNKEKYLPSYNQAPQSFCPVLVSEQNLSKNDKCSSNERCFVAMKWGLIPSWSKGKPGENRYNMANARSDTILQKKSYKVPLYNGQRCVIVAEGFYEWKTSTAGKQPYYIQFSDKYTNETIGSRKLLTIAGIFEKSNIDNEVIYSFSMITVDASTEFSVIHHRMPALLENDEEISKWLDHKNILLDDALSLIHCKNCLQWYPVSKYVNNSRNNGPECIKEVSLTLKENILKPDSSVGIMKWTIPLTSASSKENNAQSNQSRKRTTASLDKWLKKKKEN